MIGGCCTVLHERCVWEKKLKDAMPVDSQSGAQPVWADSFPR